MKNFFYSLLLSIVNILFPILSFPYASRILGPEGIGKAQFVFSFAQYFALFAALGIPIYGVKEIARYRDDPQKRAAVFAELSIIFGISSILVFAVYAGVLYSFPYFANDRKMYLAAGMLVLLGFSYTDWYYSGIEAFRTITLRSIVIKLMSLVFLYVFVQTPEDLHHYLYILVFSVLGNQVYSFIAISSTNRFSKTGLELKKHLKPLMYIFGATLASSIYTVWDTVLLGFLSNTRAVGYYTASVKIVKILLPFVTVMGTILIPTLSKYFAGQQTGEAKKLLDQSFHYLVFFSLPVATGIIALAPEFMYIFSGESFVAASVSMQILALLPILVGFGHFFSFQILIPSGRNREIFISMLGGLAASALLNFLLVPCFADRGAAIATVVTELIVTGAYCYFVQKHFAFRYHWRFALQSLLASLLFFPLILLLRKLPLQMPVFTALSVLISALVYVIMHLFVFKNHFLYNFIRPIRNRFRI